MIEYLSSQNQLRVVQGRGYCPCNQELNVLVEPLMIKCSQCFSDECVQMREESDTGNLLSRKPQPPLPIDYVCECQYGSDELPIISADLISDMKLISQEDMREN